MHQALRTSDHNRDLFLEQIPVSARNILLIQSDSEKLRARIKSEREGSVIGLESDSVKAAEARAVLDEVIQAEVEALVPGFATDLFDCVAGWPARRSGGCRRHKMPHHRR